MYLKSVIIQLFNGCQAFIWQLKSLRVFVTLSHWEVIGDVFTSMFCIHPDHQHVNLYLHAYANCLSDHSSLNVRGVKWLQIYTDRDPRSSLHSKLLELCCWHVVRSHREHFADNSVMSVMTLLWCCCCSCGKTEEEVDTGVTTMDAAKDVRQLLNWWLAKCKKPREGMKVSQLTGAAGARMKRSQKQPMCHRLPLTCRDSEVEGKQQICFSLDFFYSSLVHNDM